MSLPPLLVMGASLHAEVYKWVDAQGKVHYGDHPGTTQSQQVQIQATPQQDPDAAARTEKSQKLLNEYSDEGAEKKQQEAKHAQEDAQRKANCESAKKDLDAYEHAGTLYVTDKNGERRNLDGEEYNQALESSRAEVKKWCGS